MLNAQNIYIHPNLWHAVTLFSDECILQGIVEHYIVLLKCLCLLQLIQAPNQDVQSF